MDNNFMGGAEMKWQRKVLYVAYNDQGVIVGVSESNPNPHESAHENVSQEPYSASSDVPSKTGIRADASVSSFGLAFPNQRKAVGD